LDPFVVELVGNRLPFGDEATPQRWRCKEMEGLGGFACSRQNGVKLPWCGLSGANRPETGKAACDQCRAPRARVFEQPHLTPPVRASARPLILARDRIVSRAMMGKRTFHPFKASGERPEKSKRAEMVLTWFSKVLAIWRRRRRIGREPRHSRERACDTRSG
jgi:hypothetical protein